MWIKRIVLVALCAVAGLIAAGAGTAGAIGVTGAAGLPPTLAQAAATVKACDTPAEASDATQATACEAAAEQVGDEAYLYGIAPLEFVRQAAQQTSVNVPNRLADAPINQFGSDVALNTPQPGHSVFVQPNVDTLYTMGHLNLSSTALVLHVPQIAGHRYYVMQFLDPYTNAFAYVGTRTTGDGAHGFLITGPHWKGTVPTGLKRIRSPYDLAWIVGRTLVNGPKDLAAVHAIQKQYQLIPLADYRADGLSWTPAVPKVKRTTAANPSVPTGLGFYTQLGAVLKASPPPAIDRPVLADLAEAGIGPGLNPATQDASAAVRQGLTEAADNGLTTVANDRLALAAGSSVTHNGWFVPNSDTGRFGDDYEWRAITAVYGLAANVPAEALYIVGVLDANHARLDASKDYVIHFAADALPPARFFWSLTMYDNDFSLVPNPLGRYALANHIPGLKFNADGSLDIYVSHARPAADEVSNWLPAPASGPFEITLRLYGPRTSAVSGTYTYPVITPVTS
jgi:hypothetical protein